MAKYGAGELQVTEFTIVALAGVKLIPPHFMREIKSFYCFVELNGNFLRSKRREREIFTILLGKHATSKIQK